MPTVKISSETNSRLEEFLSENPHIKKQGVVTLAIEAFLDKYGESEIDAMLGVGA